MNKQFDERTLDLLSENAIYGLTEEQLRELESLDSRALESSEALELEMAAAELSLMGIDANAQMPEHLFNKIVGTSKGLVAAEADVFSKPRKEVVDSTSSSGLFGWLGWAAAAAACIALAVNIFTTRNAGEVATIPSQPPAETEKLTPAQLRQRLLESKPSVVRAEWGKGNVPASEGISGDVVWSDEEQVGYMRIKGLPVNDASKEQYQLWIFENAELEKFPKDGGVFDVNSEGEVIIPIDAKLLTRDPKAFAITVEKPGGVVRSEREKIAGLAAVKPSQS